MKSKTEYLTFNTETKRAFMNITPDVRKIVQDSKIKEEGNRRVNNKNPGCILSSRKKWLLLNANSRIA